MEKRETLMLEFKLGKIVKVGMALLMKMYQILYIKMKKRLNALYQICLDMENLMMVGKIILVKSFSVEELVDEILEANK